MAEPEPAPLCVELDEVTLRYPGAATPAVEGLTFAVERGEVVTLLGPSGCGKTTALRLIAGLETADVGAIRLNGQEITRWPPERRRMGFVFQNYALFPHLTVAENVAFGLEVRRSTRDEVRRAVASALDLVHLGDLGSRRIDQLSGGQQQRVALARALAIEPEVLLLDEPLSNLDASLREQTREALRELLGRLRITTFFVTHDQSEAITFSDRIALMRAGRLVEVGPPERLYREPVRRFTAEFLGGANVLGATVVVPGERVALGPGGLALEVRSWSDEAAAAPAGSQVALVARAESLELRDGDGPNCLGARVVDTVYFGPSYRITLEVDGSRTRVRAVADEPPRAPEGYVAFPAGAIRVIADET